MSDMQWGKGFMDICAKNLERIRRMDGRLADILDSFIKKIAPV